MNEINATDFSRIEILEIKKIDVATDILTDETAIYPCEVEWKPADGETPYVGKINAGMVQIVSILKSAIKPGVYAVNASNFFEKQLVA